MECAVITTYRCNARCGMCHTWKYPTEPAEEFEPAILEKLPAGMQRLNITGGEPMLREDIREIVRILDRKTNRLEVSTNGFFYDKVLDIAGDYPGICIRVSVEGLPYRNNRLRGLQDGFGRALRLLLRLKQMGVRDIGFAMTISGENCADLMDLYHLAALMDVELANAVVHNSFYFHKEDNMIANPAEFETAMVDFMRQLLTSPRARMSRRIKDWFRAYINAGLLNHARGEQRSIACGAGTDTFFVDPWGRVLACNGSSMPLVMGDLKTHGFDEIWHCKRAESIRKHVRECRRGCWMTGTAVPAMRRRPVRPLLWVLMNKMRIMQGRQICA
ncbi:MAG: radical SAM protein [Desulfobacteraceae bacterium]|nr:radical SAM protein [Desulfobacteraceae bacterium]